MAFSKIFTGAISGIEGRLVEVETNLDNRGFPGFTIVGLPGKEVDEARERVRSAIKNSGYQFPDKKIIVNLAPADLHKKGSLYDLPIALGVLAVNGVLEPALVSKVYVVGELSLSGSIYKVSGLVPLVLEAVKTFEKVIVPFDSLPEVYNIAPGKIFGFSNLTKVIEFISKGIYVRNENLLKAKKEKISRSLGNHPSGNIFSKIVGQDFAKRAIQIAAAGGHNIALFGPPGTGKSILAKSLPELLPPLNEEELIEVAKIHSVCGFSFATDSLVRPFRNPHHSTTKTGMIGGGNPLLPGEISLAHNGVLFMDEFTEFSRSVIESLRGPIEDQYVAISRSGGNIRFPCSFILALAFNPCPCGNYGNPQKPCVCPDHIIKKYRAKLSGPILDRIDIFVNCRSFDVSLLAKDNTDESNTLKIKKQIDDAFAIQQKRYNLVEGLSFNRDLKLDNFNDLINLSDDAVKTLNSYAQKMALSPRSYHRLAKVARTIADLSLEDQIKKEHILEALQYRIKF